MEMEIKEELQWSYVIYRWGKEWSRHSTREAAEKAFANIISNEIWMKNVVKKSS